MHKVEEGAQGEWAVLTKDTSGINKKGLLKLGRYLQRKDYHFTTVTPLTHARNRERHRRAENLRDIFGWSLPFDKALLSSEEFDLLEEAGVLEPYADNWRSIVRWSSLNGLLMVHSAYPTDTADAVFFGPDTYRFARLIGNFISRRPDIRRAVDIGTGSGAGAIVIGRECPQAQVAAVDINPRALVFSAVNAELADMHNVRPVRSDLLADTRGGFDLVVANPPYMIDPLGRSYRHGGDDLGAELSWRIVDEALTRLTPGGTLLLYTGVAIVDGVDMFRQRLVARLGGVSCHWHYEEIDPDVFSEELLTAAYARVERIAVVGLQLTLPTSAGRP